MTQNNQASSLTTKSARRAATQSAVLENLGDTASPSTSCPEIVGRRRELARLTEWEGCEAQCHVWPADLWSSIKSLAASNGVQLVEILPWVAHPVFSYLEFLSSSTALLLRQLAFVSSSKWL